MCHFSVFCMRLAACSSQSHCGRRRLYISQPEERNEERKKERKKERSRRVVCMYVRTYLVHVFVPSCAMLVSERDSLRKD